MKKREKIKLIKDNLTDYQVIENYALFVGSHDSDVPSDSYTVRNRLTEDRKILEYYLYRDTERISEQIDNIDKKLDRLEQLEKTDKYKYYIEVYPDNKLKGLTEKQAADYCLNLPYNTDYLNMIINDYNLK